MSRRSVALVAAGLGALVILTNLPLLTGAAFPIWDGDAAYAPWQMLIGDAARDLRLLIWNPWSNGGSPDGFDPQFGARSPVNLLFGLVFGGSLASYYALWLTTWWLSGVGMLLLCRWLGASAPAAALAALAFSFSGFQLCHGQHMSFVLVYGSMPFVVWRLDVALCHRRLLPLAESGAIFGLASLGGYPGVSVVSALFLGLFALGRVGLGHDEASGWPDARGAKPAWLARGAVLWGAVALVAAAPTTLGLAYEARGFSDRSEAVAFERAVEQNAMVPAALLSAFGPSVANAKTAARDRWPGTDVSSMSFYLGAVPLWLALCGLLLARRRTTAVWLAAMGLLGLGLALGTTLPLRGWLYEVFPPSRYFRHASIFRAWFELAFALGAALGWRELVRWWRAGPSRGWRRAAPPGAAFALALGALAQIWIVDPGEAALPGATGLALHGVLVWSTLLGLATWLFFAQHRAGERLGGVAPLLCALAIADLSATAWIQRPLRMDVREETAESWREVAARRHRGFDLVALDTPREFASELFPVNTNKNLLQRIPTLRNYSPLSNRFHRASVRSLHSIPWAIGEDRIWFVPRQGAGFVALSDANHALVAKRFAETLHRILPLHLPADVLAPVPEGEVGPRDREDAATLARMSPAARLPHRIITYQPERLVLEATAPRPGYVVVTDRWARGWKARVDGREATLLAASFVFRAVPVAAGAHTIEMIYEPRSHAPLLAASWGTLLAVAAVSLAAGLRRRSA